MPMPTLRIYSNEIYTKQWTSNIVLPYDRLEFARFKGTADKRQFNVFPLCLPSAFSAFDEAKVRSFWKRKKLERINFGH